MVGAYAAIGTSRWDYSLLATLQVYMQKVHEQEGNPHVDAQPEITKFATILLTCQPTSKGKFTTIIARGQTQPRPRPLAESPRRCYVHHIHLFKHELGTFSNNQS